MKVLRPTNNPITGQYTDTHRAYDFAGKDLPDEIRAGLSGLVVETANLYTTNWINNGTHTTGDYGNYIIVKHDDNSRELHAHLKKDSMLPINTRVSQGQVIARIGNTGNSTGPHVHSEYRDSQNRNIPVEFITNLPSEPMNPLPTELQKYRIDWKEIAVNKGLDVNSAIFLDYRNIDKILSDKLKSVTESKDKEIQSLRSTNEDLNIKLAVCKSTANSDEYTKLGHSVVDIIKKAQTL